VTVGFLAWLQNLGADADPSKPGFQPQAMYLVMSVVLPVFIGLVVGLGLRVIERVVGVELGRGGHR
jgi:hypothetical protein